MKMDEAERVTSGAPDFDGIASLYRWMEYMTLGPVLMRTRLAHLALLPLRSRALVLGDGDGRFTARLLREQAGLCVEAVDLSAAMLRLLERNVERAGAAERLCTRQADVRALAPAGQYDLIVTHFLLDCLTDAETAALIGRLGMEACGPGACWLVSEFCVPDGILQWPARVYIRVLYAAFFLLTGLRVTRLPEFRQPLRKAGFHQVAVERRLFGVLVAELWRR